MANPQKNENVAPKIIEELQPGEVRVGSWHFAPLPGGGMRVRRVKGELYEFPKMGGTFREDRRTVVLEQSFSSEEWALIAAAGKRPAR